MLLLNNWTVRISALALACVLASSCGFRRRAYENPITKDTEQPDKVLYDKAIADLEKGRYEVARLVLQNLMNTYDTSEYLAKAKLAYADSWYREGGSHGLAQAEAEYKDFILFYPTLEEAAEAQEKVCMIHYKQMEKADRDMLHAVRAEDECRNLLVQFPNSKFAPRVAQTLRNIQEVIAEGEFRRGAFYANKGSHPAAANRLQALVDHYPLFSKADEANWMLGNAYEKLPPRFRQKAGDAYARIVRDYPLSSYVEDAKKKLKALEIAVPEADPVAYARMKYEIENRDGMGPMGHFWGIFRKSPDTRAAARSGTPAMTSLRPTVPLSVPTPAAAGGFTGDVTAQPVGDNSALDTQPDARRREAAGDGDRGESAANAPQAAAAAAAAVDAPGGNRPAATANQPQSTKGKKDKKQDKKKNGK
ncbi:MAG TPA: outer membrane protein assembly factor BamD [Bryobacteraceae bacterium]|nr:outer membrane protein assembly factor BamD [Bryobacteraceae bacterium]